MSRKSGWAPAQFHFQRLARERGIAFLDFVPSRFGQRCPALDDNETEAIFKSVYQGGNEPCPQVVAVPHSDRFPKTQSPHSCMKGSMCATCEQAKLTDSGRCCGELETRAANKQPARFARSCDFASRNPASSVVPAGCSSSCCQADRTS